MADETKDFRSAPESLDEILAECIAAEEAGRPLDRRALSIRYPQFAADLDEFFANRDRMERLAAPLRESPDSPPRRRAADSFGPSAPLGRVRYFGDYELLDEVAAGGMGIVYKARQVSLNRIVAVKMILKGTLASEDDVKRFRAEAEAAANLQHPSIVAIHEVGLHEGQHYFSMDFVEGESLAERLRDRPLAARDAARYVSEAAQAVHYAHQQGTLHRDLKPSNILIDRHDRVRITDFGLAKRIEDQSDLTLTGQILGTPSYMPPEQALGKRSLIGAASDVYALGAVLYELLAGRPPFRGETPAATLREVETLDPVAPRLLSPATPRDLETICLKCLEKEPHKRYGTAQLLADDLARFLHHEPILARPIGGVARAWRWCKRKPAVATEVLAVVVAITSLLGGGAMLLDNVRVGEAHRNAERARKHAVDLSSRLQIALDDAEEARDNEASLRVEKEAALGKLQDAYGELDSERATTQDAWEESEKLRYQLQIVAADRALQDKEVSNARELLLACPESRRNWEWHYLQHLTAYDVRTCCGLAETVRDVAIAPEGNSYYAVTVDGRLVHWDISTDSARPLRKELASLEELTCVAVHAATQQLAVGDQRGSLQIIDLSTGDFVLSKQLHSDDNELPKNPLTELTFRADGGCVAALTSSSAHVISLDPVHHWSLDCRDVQCIALHPSQNLAILGAGVEGKTARGQVRRGQWLAQWNYAETDRVTNLAPEIDAVTSLALNSKGLLAAGMASGDIELWQLTDKWKRAFELKSHAGPIRDLYFRDSAQRLVSASDDQTMRIWDTDKRELLATLRDRQSTLGSIAVGADESCVLTASDTSATLWDVGSREGSHRLIATGDDSQREKFFTIDVRPDGGELAAVGLSGRIYTFDTATLTGIEGRRGVGRRSISYGSVPAQLVLGGSPPAIFDLSQENPIFSEGPAPQSRVALTDVAFLADGERLATASNPSMYRYGSEKKSVVAIWDLATGSCLKTLEGCQQLVWALEASPDQRYFATAGGTGTSAVPGELKVWDAETGQLVYDLKGHELPIWSIAFSPDGKRLASGAGVWSVRSVNRRSELKIWDLEFGRLLLNLEGHDWTVMDLVFSPDGRRLYSASEDCTVRVWPGVGNTSNESTQRRADSAFRSAKELAAAGQWQWAIAEYDRSIEYNPNLQAARRDRGWANFNLKRWDAAIADYREALRLNPRDAAQRVELHRELGKTYAAQGAWPDAIAAYEVALDHERPGRASSYNSFAWLLANCPQEVVRNPKRAVELARQATEWAPQNASYWNTLGTAHYRHGDWEAAGTAVEKSMNLDAEQFAFGHNALVLAMTRWQQGDGELSHSWYDAAVTWAQVHQQSLALDQRGAEIEQFQVEAAALLGIELEN
jgi:WD40 repeat protein/tRNA A-37 threonylcarbamoyl transferase component Bud32